MNKYVISGGPGIGKTTVIEILASRGYTIIPEAARMIIEEEEIKGSQDLPWLNIEKFQRKVAERQIELESVGQGDVAFLDRGLVDGYAYCAVNNVSIPQIILNESMGRYEKVFILEPLTAYENDMARLEEKNLANVLHNAIIDAYRKFGYELTMVPVLPPEERVDFILKAIA